MLSVKRQQTTLKSFSVHVTGITFNIAKSKVPVGEADKLIQLIFLISLPANANV